MHSTERLHLTNTRLYTAGDCPVCPGSGDVLYLEALGTGTFIFFCPLCSVAWQVPPEGRLDAIIELRALAPDGVSLPLDSDVAASGLPMTPVPLEKWFAILVDEVER